MNHSLLQYLQNNYSKLLKRFKNVAAPEMVEDAISKVTIRLLTIDYGLVKFPATFLGQGIFNEISNIKRSTRKWVHNEDLFIGLASPCIFSQIENDQQEKVTFRRVMRMAYAILSDKQLNAVNTYLQYDKFSQAPGNVETLKSNFRYAKIKLQKTLGDING